MYYYPSVSSRAAPISVGGLAPAELDASRRPLCDANSRGPADEGVRPTKVGHGGAKQRNGWVQRALLFDEFTQPAKSVIPLL